ncbi:MAG: hypothetical protein KF779_16595 [Hyphomonadaceae bacterium]|nr:hypothetical protein [Hyphomonadaceae bacterium]
MVEAKQRDPSLRRRRTLTASAAVLLMAAGGAAEAVASHDGQWRLIDWVRVGAVLFLALVISLRATTSFSLRARDPALDDELARANRASAAAFGFWALFACMAAAFVGSFFFELRVVEIAPTALVIGAAAAGLRFVLLERQGE